MVKDNRKVAVLFDLEDTLVRTPWADMQHVLEFRRETRRKLIELGTPASILEGIERATIMRNKASEYIAENFGKADAQKFHQQMEVFLRRYELDSAEKSELFPETVPTLEKIKELGLKVGLVTNTSREAVETVFRLHCLKMYFDVVITRENVKKLKPEPEGVSLAVKKLGAKNFFMVGDQVHDALAVRSANGMSIIVKRNPEEKLHFHADFFVRSLSEVPAIIQKATRTTAEKDGFDVQSGEG